MNKLKSITIFFAAIVYLAFPVTAFATQSDMQNAAQLELNKEYNVGVNGGDFYYIPSRSGDYQFCYELFPDTDVLSFGIGAINQKPPMNIDVSAQSGRYFNIYLRGGEHYMFKIQGASSIKLSEDNVQDIYLNETKKGAKGNDKLFVFIPKERGRYVFESKKYGSGSNLGDLSLYIDKNGFSVDRGQDSRLKKSILIEAGERCYIRVRDSQKLYVKKAEYRNETPKIAEMWLVKDWEQLAMYPQFKPSKFNVKFNVNQSSKQCRVNASQKKPWLALTLSAESAKPVLKNSSGNIVPWKGDYTMLNGKITYSTPLSVNQVSRRYSLTLIPESGLQSNAQTYIIFVDPK